jgi:hypothetical protein
MDDRRRRLDPNERGSRQPAFGRSRSRTADEARDTRDLRVRPWQRPPQFQHGHHDNAFGDAEATRALLARLAAARDWERRSVSLAGRCLASGTRLDVPFEVSWDQDATEMYLGLLDRILEDRVITDAELGRLQEAATVCGIGCFEAACLHRGYVAMQWARARTDASVTPGQLRDIETLADFLGVQVEVRRHHARRGKSARWVAVAIEAESTALGPRTGSTPGTAARGRHPDEARRARRVNDRR